MRRRDFILAFAAAAIAGCGPSSGRTPPPPPFEPTRFSVEIRGAGPDVILIPGLTAGRDVWASTVAAVPGYRYHLVQVGGMAGEPVRGNSAGPVVAPLADELVRYIETRDLGRPAIVGHSMGGTLAMMVASRRPELVGKAMVVDMLPQPSALVGGSASNIRGLADSLRDFASSPSGRRLFGSLINSFGTDGRSDPDVVGRTMHELAGIDLTPDLPRIRVPLTVVYASLDARSRAGTDSAYRAAYAGARGAELVRIDDSGHMIMFDQPTRLNEAVRAFLAR
jgi:pimeloyl-ACP methyl ester carboxylesterase